VHPVHPTEVTTLQFSREALDAAVLARLAARGNIRSMSGRVARLLGGPGGARILGVALAGTADGAAPTELRADLVVDCRGRGSPIVDEMKALGYAAPAVSRVDNEMGYSSCLFRLPSAPAWELVYIQVRPGLINRGGAACHIAPDRLVVTLIGTGDDRPGAAPEEFVAFAASAHPELAEQLRDAVPLGPPRLWRSLSNVRRHFGRMRDWPRGLLVLGDALCAFNPVYGQGMTVAALGAKALDECLRAQRRWHPAGDLDGLAERFQKQLGRLVATPWLLATGEDFRYPTTDGGPPPLATRILRPYVDQVLVTAAENRQAHQAFLEVVHLMKPPSTLFKRSILVPVLAQLVRQRWRRS